MSARIRLCGRLEVELGGVRIEQRLPGRQGPLVLALLALNRSRPVPRGELIGALWPERPPADPDEALSALLSKVRQAVGRDVLTGRRELALALPADAEIDVERAEAAAERARAALAAGDAATAWASASETVEIAGRGLLPGYDAPWVHERRGELEDVRLHALELRARAGLELGGEHAAGAERAAAELVRAAPLREAGHRLLMEALAARGEVAEALAAYESLRVLLRDELGTAPGEATRALHAQLLGPGPQAPRPARLPDRLAQALASDWVGRHATLRRLRERAERAAAGEAGVVLVSGEGGIGKTRIVAELAHRMPAFEVLYGRCDEEELFPFGPWIDMLRPRLARMPEDELAELVRGAPELARLLPEIHERLPGLAGLPVAGDPEAQRRQLFGAVVTVVRRLAADGPVLMIVDDLHWADRSSLLLARHVAKEQQLGAVLIVGTFRDSELQPGHPLPELLAELERGRELPRVRLDGMDEREVAELIGGDAAPGAVSAIHAETGGNPFFVKQLARHLEELDGAPVAAAGVPQGVRDVIAARVGRLSEHAGPVLGVAALIGRDFDLDLLEPVAGLPEDELLDLLDAAVRGALLVEVPSTPGRYSFAHALLRTALEGELSAARRARAHLRIGEAIERVHEARPDPWLAELARHFGAAGPRAADRAVAYAERAAAQAHSRLAYDEAARLLGGAIALRRRDEHADREELAQLENALAAAQADAGQWEAARASFARAAVAARAAGAADAFALAALGHAGGTWEQYGVEDTENVNADRGGAATAARGGLSDACAGARPKSRSTAASSGRSPRPSVRAIADEAVAMARRVGGAQPLAAALTGALQARWRPGRAAERLELAAELIELTEAHEESTAPPTRTSGARAPCSSWAGSTRSTRTSRATPSSPRPRSSPRCCSTATACARCAPRWRATTSAARGSHAMCSSAGSARRRTGGCSRRSTPSSTAPTRSRSSTSAASWARARRSSSGWRARSRRPGGGRRSPGRTCRPAGPELARELIEEMSADGFATTPRDSNFIAASPRSRTRSPSSATRSSPRGSSRCWRPTASSGSCSGRARVHARAGRLRASGRCGCCWTGPRTRRRRSSSRSSARGDARAAVRGALAGRAGGGAARARRATRRAPPSSRRRPPRPRASSG